MKNGEARLLLGFPPNSRPTPSQVKAAYKSKVWDSHPDRFPADKRNYAESRFKMISEAYSCLLPGAILQWYCAQTFKMGVTKSRHNPSICFRWRNFKFSYLHMGHADWGTKGAWRWKTSSFSWPSLPFCYAWNSWTWKSKYYQGLQKGKRSKSIT
ncbi:uncharacterized protein LOC110732952 isoform X1 [Chenopodium quinoa]|uniref:uncharacterized protein LOC110732952 isoform X1 n=1 Tax=Chenopodium quinoa TaxID=63459 RepID=UPI000B783487|nr:uncharacterized protein LOC110732952 isoform X1 [Chenopodium quinoa]